MNDAKEVATTPFIRFLVSMLVQEKIPWSNVHTTYDQVGGMEPFQDHFNDSNYDSYVTLIEVHDSNVYAFPFQVLGI